MSSSSSVPPHTVVAGGLRDRSPSGFRKIPFKGRVALFIVVTAVAVADAVIYLSTGAGWREIVIGLPSTLATILFVWWPGAAATTLLAAGLMQTAGGQQGGHVLFIVGVLGLVVYTSPPWFVAVYTAGAGGIVALTWVTSSSLAGGGMFALVILGAVSSMVGWGLRSAHKRENSLERSVRQMKELRAAEIAAERERIADELHDIIAHDVTLVAMHARVLERVDTAEQRAQSLAAIKRSADQALADIRRVLRIVRDDDPFVVPSANTFDDVDETLRAVRRDLDVLGATIIMDVQAAPDMSSTIATAVVHVLREGATNIAKHAGEQPRVFLQLATNGAVVSVRMRSSLPARSEILPPPSSGYGIVRLRERVALLGGEFRAGSALEGWGIFARLPLQ